MYNQPPQNNNANIYHQQVPNQNPQNYQNTGNNNNYVNNQQGYMPPQQYNPQPQQYPISAGIGEQHAIHQNPISGRPILSEGMKYLLIGMSLICLLIFIVAYFLIK
jgi:hypothetical protein